MSRPLLALNINDEVPLSATTYSGFLEIENADGVGTVQRILHTRGHRGADLFLVDIDMERSGNPKGLEWGDPRFRAYGPLLALPFIGGPIAAFVPYSGFWGNEKITNNGFVRVALSLLLARIYDRPFSLDDVGAYIRRSADGTSGTGLVKEANIALLDCLRQYRDRIESDARIQLVDVELTLKRLQDLEQQAVDANRWPLEIPLTDGEGVLSVDICYAGKHRDRIQLSSLCGDLLRFREPTEPNDLVPVYEVLDRWKTRSVTVRGDTLYDSVVDVLDRCLDAGQLNKCVDQTPYVRDGDSRYQVIRLAMEFAWVHAWFTEATPRDRVTCVHRLLGLAHVRNADGELEKVADRANPYKRLLGEPRKNDVAISAQRFRTPLKRQVDPRKVSEAYGLNDENDDGTLEPYEKQYCIRYAIEKLGWDPTTEHSASSNRPYPRWLQDD